MTWTDRVLGTGTESTTATHLERFVAVFVGFGLTIFSVIAGILAVVGLSILFNSTGIPLSDAVQLLRTRAIQVGFLGVALLYLSRRPQLRRSINFDVPSVNGIAWIIAIPLLSIASGFVLEPVLAFVGIAPPAPTGTTIDGFTSRPVLWLTVLIGWFVIAAPAEELLFRGVIQGRLRETFAPVSGIVLAAVFFGLMHIPIAALSTGMEPASSFIQTIVSGLIFGVAYERTDNLVVPSIAHAVFWASALVV
jgi:membrane protease YdiL (CAAX protease family)